MKKAFLVTPLSKNIPILSDYDYIGVDAGSLLILNQNLPLKFCVGDFDSMNEKDFERLQGYEIEKHPIMKDETDSELAIRLCKERGYSEIILYGALGGRIDHTISNIRLLMYSYPEIVLMDDQQKIRILKKGIHTLKKEYKHISFFAIEPTVISLSGFLYNVHKAEITVKDIYTVSNSFVEKNGMVDISNGSLLCIESNYK